MRGTDVVRGLRALETQLSDILDSASGHTLAKAQKCALKEEELYHKYRQTPNCEHKLLETGWGFRIDDPHSLRFKECYVNKYCYRVDVLCEFRWKWSSEEQCSEPHQRSLILRVWSRDNAMVYREEWDSECVLRSMVEKPGEAERVMVRFHFDRAPQGASEPLDHFQVGGIARSDEYSWMPSQLDVPRVPYPPQDLYLVCELIGANFYGQRYRTISTDALWRHQILESQELCLKDYYEGCLKAIDRRKSVLVDHLWQA